MKRKSQKFQPSRWLSYLVPALLVVLVLGLILTVGIVMLSVLGLTPGF